MPKGISTKCHFATGTCTDADGVSTACRFATVTCPDADGDQMSNETGAAFGPPLFF